MRGPREPKPEWVPGLISRFLPDVGTRMDRMDHEEHEYWMKHILPFGWMIISEPRLLRSAGDR